MRRILDEISTIGIIAMCVSLFGMVANMAARYFIEVTCYNEDIFEALWQICLVKFGVELIATAIISIIEYIIDDKEDSEE